MYQSQQFQAPSYRGNQLGQNTYLSADSPFPSGAGAQNVASQYRGIGRPFQPTGYVSSVYGQNLNAGGFNQSQSQAGFTSAGAQSYHAANYRGNQPGHDSYLRSDSNQPSQSRVGVAGGLSQSSFTPTYQTMGAGTSFGQAGLSSYNQNQTLNQNQFVSPESYHAANYRGNQPGHDSYLRSDSSQPSQSQFGIGATGTGYGQVAPSNFGASAFSNVPFSTGSAISSAASSSFGGAGLGTSAMGASSLGASGISSFNQNQFVSPESFHSANYRGNQPGHDNYLRSDSSQPSQSQFATGLSSTANFGAGGSRGF